MTKQEEVNAKGLPVGDLFLTQPELFDMVCSRLLGCQDRSQWISRFIYWTEKGWPPKSALFNALVDLIHDFNPEVLAKTATTVERNLTLTCIDWQACFSDGRHLALLALLASRMGNTTQEKNLLRALYADDAHAFWQIVQSVYRFLKSVPELCFIVGAKVKPWKAENPLHNYRVYFYPAYSNNYQKLLYAPLKAAGGQAVGFRSLHEWFANVPDYPAAGTTGVLHMHWENELVSNRALSRGKRAALATEFFAWLRARQAAGYRVFWTIHNYLSHECVDRAAEIALRQELYQLADEVFVHHPLAAELLDWLPDRNKLRLCEHGAYDLATAAFSRETARRALGFGEDEWVVAHVGQVRDYKGLDTLLPTLFEQLDARPRMRLLIAGQLKSAAVRAWLAAHGHPRLTVRDEFMDDDVLIQMMRAADVGLLAYRSILTSGSLVHWLSCGRPVIAPALGTIPAYVVPGWNGWLYEGTDGLQRSLDIAASLPHEEYKRLEDNALATAHQLEWKLWQT